MGKVYLYMVGDNPLKSFIRNECKPTNNFCFFSSKDEANKHLYREWVEEWHPSSEDDIKWAEEHIWVSPDEVESFKDADQLTPEVLAEFARQFARRYDDEYIIECDMDVFDFR